MQKILFRGMSILLISSVSLQAFAASVPTGMIYVTGPVKINGKSVAAPTAVFKGDSVQTASAAGATIASKGLRITLASGTGLAFAEKSVAMSCGTAAFQSSTSTPVTVGRFSVSPSDKNAHFQVMNRGGLVQIAALEGGINIFDGKQTLGLAAGKMFTVPSADACIDAQNTDSQNNSNNTNTTDQSTTNGNNKKKGGATTTTTTTGTSGTGGGGIGAGATTAIVIGGAAAIGLTAGILASQNNHKNVASPVLP